jgi:TetR/AcrR family transcriptional regulator, regulator of autoinduction and epiphytic fitness
VRYAWRRQLAGPVAFARLTGLRTITRQDCERIMDDFLTAHRREISTSSAESDPKERAATATSS